MSVPTSNRYPELTDIKGMSVAYELIEKVKNKIQDQVCCTLHLIRTSIYDESDVPWRIGALPSQIRLTDAMPWGGVVFMMNTRQDCIRTSI